jgi:predicted kinase
VVVSGPPGSGKTTLARQLATGLRLPLIAKDTIKEALMTVLDVPDVHTSRVLGRAAVAALYAVAEDAKSGVLESAWHRKHALADLGALPGPMVEVFCRCDLAVAQARYVARATSRAAGHFDAERLASELWNDDVGEPVAGGWPVIEVDTNEPVDVGIVIEEVRAALAN